VRWLAVSIVLLPLTAPASAAPTDTGKLRDADSAKSAGAASSISAEHAKCVEKSEGVTSDMLECDSVEFKKQDKRLNDNYKVAMRTAPTEGKVALKDAQRKWIEYRDTTCNLFGKMNGGTLATLIDSSCLLRETAKRADLMKELADLQ